jgi:hypothetical protein
VLAKLRVPLPGAGDAPAENCNLFASAKGAVAARYDVRMLYYSLLCTPTTTTFFHHEGAAMSRPIQLFDVLRI